MARRVAAAKDGRLARAKAEMPLYYGEQEALISSIEFNWGLQSSRILGVGADSPLEHLDDD